MIVNTLSEIVARSGVKFGTSGARGLVADMSDDVCYAYAQAFMQTLGQGHGRIVIGHDLRPSSPRITAACAQAVADAGAQVVYVGALPTPAIAYYAACLGVPAIVVTGSHIPFDRNGIKFYRAEGEISKADEIALLEASISLPPALAPAALPAVDGAAEAAYLSRYTDYFGANALAGMRIGLYQHSSVARDILARLLENLGASVLPLGRSDSFVPIDTEAVRPEDVVQARAWAAEPGFDALLSTDGDADRPLIGDEAGTWLRGDIVGILCAAYLQADVVVTPVSSNTAVEACGKFRQVLRTRIGSPYVIAGMEAGQAADAKAVVVGYEANGGFLLGADVVRNGQTLRALPTRDAVLPMLALLVMGRQAGGLSRLSGQLPARFTASDRIQGVATDASLALIAHLQTATAEIGPLLAPESGAVKAIDTTDGLRVSFDSGDIVHLRPSGNAPELRCYAESAQADRAEALCQACLARVKAKLVG